MNLLTNELRRIWRGVLALEIVFGSRFTVGMLVTFVLLLAALLMFKGWPEFLFGLVCVLLAIRAHADAEQEEEPSEFNTYWEGYQSDRSELQRVRDKASRFEVSGQAAADFNRLDADRADVIGRRAGHDV